jgi:hypothetical protein
VGNQQRTSNCLTRRCSGNIVISQSAAMAFSGLLPRPEKGLARHFLVDRFSKGEMIAIRVGDHHGFHLCARGPFARVGRRPMDRAVEASPARTSILRTKEGCKGSELNIVISQQALSIVIPFAEISVRLQGRRISSYLSMACRARLSNIGKSTSSEGNSEQRFQGWISQPLFHVSNHHPNLRRN